MAGWKYNSAADTPHTGGNYMLTPEYWEETVLAESWQDTLFTDLISEEGGPGMIVFNPQSLRKGGKQSTVAMRWNPAAFTKPAKGDTQIVDYTDFAASLVEDMTFAKMQVYAGQERFAWQSLGRENVRMAYQLDVINQSAQFIADLFKQRKEESVIHTLIFGLSQSVTRVGGKGGATDQGHMKKVPPSFKRGGAAGGGSYGITKMPHPNTFFMDEAEFATTITAAGADVNFDTIVNVMDTETTGADCKFSVAAITRAAAVMSKLKIKPVATPFGPRWLWFVPNECEPDIKSALLTYHAQAGPRDYGSNRLWSGTLGDFGGFLFIKTHYLTTMAALIAAESLTGAAGYDDGQTGGTMAIAITETVAYPTLICGEGALAYCEPEGMSAAEERPDLENIHIRGAYHTYGYRRADWFLDTTTDYFANGVTNVVSGASLSGTVACKNFSSALVMVKASGATM